MTAIAVDFVGHDDAEVWVASFQPFDERSTVGGFEWRWTLTEANRAYEEMREELRETHIVRLVRMEVNLGGLQDLISEELMNRVDEMEVEAEPLRQHIPEGGEQ